MAEVRPALGSGDGGDGGGDVDAEAVRDAAARLAAGDLVAFPTETVYGLGAATFDANAIARIYALKGRPSDNPLIAHVDAADPGMLESVTTARGGALAELAAAFWPGPLTVVLPRAAAVPASASGGRDTIAVRCPRHPVAVALLRAFGGPVSAPSANVSGHVSPTSAAHVAAEFPASDLLILDGGPCDVGLESTVLDLTCDPPRVLRPGSITASALRTVVAAVDAAAVHGQAASPGTRARHYAPRSRVAAVTVADLGAALRSADGPRVVLGRAADVPAASVAPPHRRIGLPDDPAGFGRRLYAAVREADAFGGETMILLVMPAASGDEEAWGPIRDRLSRMVAD